MLALLCGGQGLIAPGIFDLLGESAEAAPILGAAATLLGSDPRAMVRAGDAAALSENRVSQILSVTASLALYAAIADVLPAPCAVIGYSVGEMAAWSLAGVWSPEEALRLTAARAEAMTAAAREPGRLAYARGLGETQVSALAEAERCAIAIRNPGALFVVGGTEVAIARFCVAAREAGAVRAEPLAVRIAAHTPLLDAAIAPFATALNVSTPRDPARQRLLLSGSGGARVFRAAPGLARLAAQVARPIDWAGSLEALFELGCDRFLDLGPGAALAAMARAIDPSATVRAAGDFRSLDGLRRWCTG